MKVSNFEIFDASPDGARRSQAKGLFIERANHERCVGSKSAPPASRFSASAVHCAKY
jgi:hypothetical protein